MDDLELDGSHGEGGGQILRTALFLSTLLGLPFRCDRIRAGRREPGLKAQHLAILEILARTTGARVEGARVGSPEVRFEPGAARGGSFQYDVGTAGSLPLLLQTLLPVAALAPAPFELRLVGGTDVTWGPTIDWVRNVYVPLVRPVTPGLDVAVERRGFYPKGGGRVVLRAPGIPGGSDRGAFAARISERWTGRRDVQGRIITVGGSSIASASLGARDVAGRQRQGAESGLAALAGPKATISEEYADTLSVGTSLTLWAVDEHGNRCGGDGLGAPKTTAEEVGRDVARRLIEDLRTGATVDRHLADHLVPWVALGAPAVRVPMATGHLETNIWVCQRFLGSDAVRLADGVLKRG